MGGNQFGCVRRELWLGNVSTSAALERASVATTRRRVATSASDPSRKAEIITLALLGLLTVASALVAGGAFPTVVMILAPLAIAAAVASTWIARSRRSGTLSAFYIFAGLAAFTLIQLVPLPMGVLARVSPQAADTWSRALAPLGESIASAPLSLDPSGTTLEALKWAAYACVFAAAAAAARRRGAEYGALIVFGSAVLVAFATLGHQLFEAKKLFGIYHPIGTNENEVAPFLNKNNLAGYLNLGVFAGAALLFSGGRFVPRPLAATGIVILMAVSLRSGSRAGLATLVLGVVVLAILLYVIRSRRGTRDGDWLTPGRTVALILGTLVGGLLLAFVAGDRAVFSRLTGKDLEKFNVPLWAKPMAWDFKWFGAGRGAFESVFISYCPNARLYSFYTHPENFIVQWATEWGIVGIVALVALFWVFRPTRLGVTRSALQAGISVGIATLLLQNLADLSLELFGVGVPVALLLGSTWGDAKRRSGLERATSSTLPVRIVAAATAAILALTIARGSHGVADDRRELSQMFDKKPVDGEAMRVALRAAMLRHPADYFFPLVGGMVAEETDENPIPWIQRALERAPYVGRTHLVLAEILSRRGVRNQALLELRLAVEYEPGLAGVVAILAVRTTHDGALLLRAVPDGAAGLTTLDAMASVLGAAGEVTAREMIDKEELARDPSLRAPRERLVGARLAALSKKLPPCEDRAACERELDEHAAALTKYFPESSRGDQIRAAVDLADGRTEDARKLLDEACKAQNDAAECLQMLAPLVALSEVTPVMDRYASVVCGARATCANGYDWIATFYESKGEWGQALSAREKAIDQGYTDGRMLAAASTAEGGGHWGDAVRLLQRLARHQKTRDPALDARITGDEAKSMQ